MRVPTILTERTLDLCTRLEIILPDEWVRDRGQTSTELKEAIITIIYKGLDKISN